MLERVTFLIMGRIFSTLISGGVLLLIAPLIIQFIWTALTYKDIEAFNKLVQEENDIALILVAIGSFFLEKQDSEAHFSRLAVRARAQARDLPRLLVY